MNIEQVVNAVDIAIHKLRYMESLYGQAKDQAEKMQRTIQRLANDIEERKNKISLLDKIAFSSELECKRTEQRIRELTAQKYIIEKLIANILSDDNEGYSKLKQIVKVVLSENKQLISISFVALIQTIKADPQMVKLIQNMPNANDGEINKDNNNITNYLEFNKDRILNLGERNYENLVEVLTNNAIDTVADSSSNSILSLPSSSSFLGSYNQNNIFRIEKTETFHNSKGDIAD
jgi:hypothetical protein